MTVPTRVRPPRGALGDLRRADPLLARALTRVGPYPGFPEPQGRRAETHFAALARSILYQQLATAAAATIHRRVRALTPGPRFPRPEELLALPAATLRAAGVSANKQAALRDLAARVVDGSLPLGSIARRPDEAIVEALVAVRGIGTWSAQMFLIFRLGRLDVLPATDLGIREGLRRLDGRAERPTPGEVIARGSRWEPLRTVAAWVLWRLLD